MKSPRRIKNPKENIYGVVDKNEAQRESFGNSNHVLRTRESWKMVSGI